MTDAELISARNAEGFRSANEAFFNELRELKKKVEAQNAAISLLTQRATAAEDAINHIRVRLIGTKATG